VKLILLFCLCLTFYIADAQPSKPIAYAEIGAFSWSLFKGKSNTAHLDQFGNHVGAVTVSTIGYSFKLSNHLVNINIVALFDPQTSWTLYPHLEHPEEALNHEKRHFQICEIYARKFRQTVSKTQFHQKNFNSEIENIFKTITGEYRDEQNRYDKETAHSLNREQQEIWNTKIDQELKTLAGYSESDLTITLN
jgi:hypothetical protein